MSPAEFVAAALRVFSAISCMNPENTTAHPAAIAIRSRKPSGPLAIVMPNGRATRTMTVVMQTLFTASELRRPKTMAVRATGAARSLSKYPPSMSSTRYSAALPNEAASRIELGSWKAA